MPTDPPTPAFAYVSAPAFASVVLVTPPPKSDSDDAFTPALAPTSTPASALAFPPDTPALAPAFACTSASAPPLTVVLPVVTDPPATALALASA